MKPKTNLTAHSRSRDQRDQVQRVTIERGQFAIEETQFPRTTRERHTQAKYVAADPERHPGTARTRKPSKPNAGTADASTSAPKSKLASTYRMNRGNVKRKPGARRGRATERLSGNGR